MNEFCWCPRTNLGTLAVNYTGTSLNRLFVSARCIYFLISR